MTPELKLKGSVMAEFVEEKCWMFIEVFILHNAVYTIAYNIIF